MFTSITTFILTHLPYLKATADEWSLAAMIAGVLYALLATYLVSTNHVTMAGDESSSVSFLGIKVSFAVCIDNRDNGKYRVPGGAGTFAIGLTAWLVYTYAFPDWNWLITLARVQFLMSALDTVILWIQLIVHAGPEIVVVESHSLRHPGCGRTSGHDPVGLTLYVIQIIVEARTGKHADVLRYARGIWQTLFYDLLGSLLTPIVNLPMLIFGKVVVGWPF